MLSRQLRPRSTTPNRPGPPVRPPVQHGDACDTGGVANQHSEKQDRRAARERVASYHTSELAHLVDHVAEAVEGYRRGELDAHDADAVIHRYTKAARELWKFCWLNSGGSAMKLTARLIEEGPSDRIDWWAQAEPGPRGDLPSGE